MVPSAGAACQPDVTWSPSFCRGPSHSAPYLLSCTLKFLTAVLGGLVFRSGTRCFKARPCPLPLPQPSWPVERQLDAMVSNASSDMS